MRSGCPASSAWRRGGGPGSVWKVDGETGEISLFANILSGEEENAGPGLGGLAYHPLRHQLYVSSLETGFVYRLNHQGEVIDLFDHGTSGLPNSRKAAVAYDPGKRMSIDNPAFNVEQPETWGYTDKARRVVALAIHQNRLFYSVAEGPQIWSVGLGRRGAFGKDARLEIDLAGEVAGNMVTAMTFDPKGRLYLAQRGALKGSFDYSVLARPGESSVLVYTWNKKTKNWEEDAKEFPVGQNPPYRGTNGGMALGYLYQLNGEIDLGSCDATVWVSGENLLKSADEKVLNGLQALPGGSAEEREFSSDESGGEDLLPKLIPAAKSWAVDLGSDALDGIASGHLGAIAIYAPGCGEAAPEAIEDLEEDAYEEGPRAEFDWWADEEELGPDWDFPDFFPLPPPMPGMDISKHCQPAAMGGTLSCTIRVTNTGTLPFFFPIKVSDLTTVAAGANAGSAIAVAAVHPDAPGWTCTPTPTHNLSCGLPAMALPPGMSRSFVVDIDTSAMMTNGQVGFVNCAKLDAPYWGQACDNGGTDISVKKTAQAGCVAGGVCTFTYAFTNHSSQPFHGNVQLTDGLFRGAGGTSINAPIVAGGAGLGCGAAPASLPFSCLANLNLAGGATQTVNLQVQMPATWPNYWARNCIAVMTPGSIPSLVNAFPPGSGTLGTGGALSCAWMQVGTPGPHANLVMRKEVRKDPATGRECGKVPGHPDMVNCDFRIIIENNGPTAYTGPAIQFSDTIDPAAHLHTTDPNWNIVPGAAGVHSISWVGAALNIPDQGKIEVPVSVTTPKATVEAPGNACQVADAVALLVPPLDMVHNYLNTDDTANATADAGLLEFIVPGGASIFLCDPSNITVTKRSEGPCEKSGSGWRCQFKVTVGNEGPDAYKGPIEISEKLSNAAGTIELAAGSKWQLGVNGQGQQVYRLAQADLPSAGLLKVGDKADLELVVTVPDGRQCSLTNTATLAYPLLERHNKKTDDDVGVATVTISSPTCTKPLVCEPKAGEYRTPAGDCACKKGFSRDGRGQCQANREPEQRCLKGMVKNAQGLCVCPPNTRWNGRSCQSPERETPTLTVPPVEMLDDEGPRGEVCRRGYEEYHSRADIPRRATWYKLDRQRYCVSVRVEESCPRGMVGRWPECHCPRGMEQHGDRCVGRHRECSNGMVGRWPKCHCPDGWDQRGDRCVKPHRECSHGMVGHWPKCHCPRGTEQRGDRCVKPHRECSNGMVGRWPKCHCPQGMNQLGNRCVKQQRACPNGMVGRWPKCRCPEGWIQRDTRCIKLLNPAGHEGPNNRLLRHPR